MTGNGTSRLHIRTATERDVDRLAEYFGALSYPSRHNRFMGAVSNFSMIAFDCLVHNRKPDRFTLIAEMQHDAREAVIGEASYAVESTPGSASLPSRYVMAGKIGDLARRCCRRCNPAPSVWGISICSVKHSRPTIR